MKNDVDKKSFQTIVKDFHTKKNKPPNTRNDMTAFKLAISFLTRLPVGKINEVTDSHWPQSMAFFPICGYILSLLVFLPSILLIEYTNINPLVAAAIATVLLVYWTGALHIDGFADCCDGLGCPTDREKRLKIMKDPTIGSFAAAGLIGLLLLKTATFFQLLGSEKHIELLFIPAMARFAPVFLSWIGTYPNPSGIGKFTIGRVNKAVVIVALLTLFPVLLVPTTLGALTLMILVSLWIKKKSDKLIGGITGDVLGASIEVSEAAGLLFLCLY